ncbi:MAG: carbohydrate binding domain-containing protein [Bacteroidaceae bacterium]|nr:carbohydrate binding domain-containing protein [Bacteroidaceae bacterium]
MAVAPTAIALYNDETEVTEVALDATTTSVTLTPQFTPADATPTVTWASSDETVAIVDNGVVTAVASGTATITVTSTIASEVSAATTINVTFPETEVASEDVVIDGPAKSTVAYGDNLIKNGTFQYPNPFQGWKSGANGNCDANNFNIVTDGENKYIQAKDSKGAGDSHSISTGWPIEAGKTYVFGYKVKANTAGNSQYHVVSMTNEIGTETAKVSDDATPVTTSWTDVKYKFTNNDGYAFVQFRARWLANSTSFDDFYLVEVISESTVGNVQYAIDAIPTSNIGTGAFQYSQDAIDAANALVQGTATVADVEAAYNALQVLNAPASDAAFNIVMGELTWTNNNNATMLSTKGKAVTYYAGGRSDGGGYTSQFDKVPNTNLAQAFYFTPAEGLNKYKVYQIDADGMQRYLCTGVVYGGNANQVRTTTEVNSAEVYTITATATEGVYNFTNASGINLGAQDAGLYGTARNNNLLIVPTTKPSITINTTAAGWGTTILPFAVAEIPEGVKVYTCAEADGATLTLVEVGALEANKPYIIEGAWNETLTGDAQGTALSYKEGLLTGTYARIPAPNGAYILQKHDDKVGFFQVNTETAQPNVPANRAYLTAPTTSGVKAFYLGENDLPTAIQSVFDGLVDGDAYDLAGRKVQKLQKGGVYIINGKKVVVK